MIPKEFFEKHPLYVRFPFHVENDADTLKFPSINLTCIVCSSEQTFTCKDLHGRCIHHGAVTRLRDYTPTPVVGETILVEYNCAGCNNFIRYFLIRIGEDLEHIEKIGQFPPPSISIDENLKKMLGKHQDIFRKGLICENQGYGIGAFAYYRRIIEAIIDDLLDKIWSLYSVEERKQFTSDFEKIKNTKVAEDKIKIAKDILPPTLTHGGVNPLKTIYEVLSEGIHSKTDEECSAIADCIRSTLIALINQVTTTIESQKQIVRGTQELLRKRGKQK